MNVPTPQVSDTYVSVRRFSVTYPQALATPWLMQGVIVGFGTMGQVHLDRYRHLGVEIATIVETDPMQRRRAAAGVPRICATLADAETASIDFIDICTPTHLHYQQIRQAMASDKAIFVEKPVVRTVEEARHLRALSYHRPIFVGETEQFNPHLTPLLHYVGCPRAITITRDVNLDFFLTDANAWFLDTEKSGGIVLDCMIHDLNLLIGKYGRPQVGVVRGHTRKYCVIDEVDVALTFDRCTAQLTSRWTSTHTDAPIVLNVRYVNAGQHTVTISCDDYLTTYDPKTPDAYHYELEAFIQAVTSGKTPYPLSTYLDAVEVACEITAALPLP